MQRIFSSSLITILTIIAFSFIGPFSAHAVMYVADSADVSIKTWNNDASGNMPFPTDISGYLKRPQGVTVDASWIYVANSGNNSVAVFPIGSAGDAEPVRVIQGTNTSLDGPGAVEVDDNWIYVANDTSHISSILIEAAREVETPNTSPPSKGSLPVLSWSNQCNKKFKVWFGNDIQFSKKKSFSFNLTTLSETFSKALTSSQWNSIRKLVGDATGETIYWYVESWDGLGRYATTDVMSFVLTE